MPLRSIVRPLVVSAALCVGLQAGAQAQKLSTTPTPGLWEHRMGMTLNGVDVMAGLRAAQAEAMKELQNLPAEQRAMMAQMMQQAMAGAGGPQQSCLTPEQARAAADPQALLQQMNEEREEQGCRFALESVSGNTLKLRGTCKPEDGWNGVIAGTMTLHEAKRWSSRFSGQGKMQGEAMPGLNAPGGQVEMVMESSGRWLAADCGRVAPER